MNICGIYSFLPSEAIAPINLDALASETGLVILDQAPVSFEEGALVLGVSDQGLGLHFTGKKTPKPIWVDFLGGANAHRRQFGGGKSQLIAKAVGLKSRYRPHILDVTAGLGQDGFVLSTLGCNVTLIERVPVIFELLKDGLSRAGKTSDEQLRAIIQRISLMGKNSIEYLNSIDSESDNRPDVIYVDPMFPERQKSAQVKKNMSVFQTLVGSDNDAGDLLDLALTRAKYRVVIKRPRKAASISEQFPDKKLPKAGLVLEGKSSRYDIYPIAKMPEI